MTDITLEQHLASLHSANADVLEPEPIAEPSETPVQESAPDVAPTPIPAATPPDSEQEPQEVPDANVAALDWQVVAQGRLREINALRENGRVTRQQMANLEKSFRELQARLDPPQEIPQELLDADPVTRLLHERMKTVEDRIQTAQSSAEEQARFTKEVAETVRYAQESKAAFVSHTPDWDSAYQLVRQKFAEENGKVNDPNRDQWLNVQEHLAVKEWRENGIDPATHIYEMAHAYGWRPGAAAVTPPQTTPTNGATPRVRRVRDAVKAPSVATIGSGVDMGSDVMSRSQFYAEYPHDERVRIYNSDRGDAIFESLMKDGKVPRSMLPASPR